MPITHNVQNDTFFGTIVQFGVGDIGMAGCVDKDANPMPSMLIWQDVPKDIKDWKSKAGFTYHKEDIQMLKGHGVQLEFGRIESIDTLINVLQEVRKHMILRYNATPATSGD